MNKLTPFFALGALLLSPQARAENLVATPLHMSVRGFLAASLEGAKARYVIGTGLDGELILSVPPALLTPSQAFRIAALAVDYPIEHLMADGIRIIRRKTGQSAALPSTKTPVKKANK